MALAAFPKVIQEQTGLVGRECIVKFKAAALPLQSRSLIAEATGSSWPKADL